MTEVWEYLALKFRPPKSEAGLESSEAPRPGA